MLHLAHNWHLLLKLGTISSFLFWTAIFWKILIVAGREVMNGIPPPPILPHPSLPLYPACSHNRVQFRNKFHFLKHGKVWSWRIYTHHCTSFFRKRVSAPSIVRRREAVQFIPSWIFKKWYLFLLLSYTHYTCIYQDSYARIVRINFITSIIKMAIIKIVIKNTNRMQKQWKWTYWNLLPWLLKLEF